METRNICKEGREEKDEREREEVKKEVREERDISKYLIYIVDSYCFTCLYSYFLF